jgi:hypothetical protein
LPWDATQEMCPKADFINFLQDIWAEYTEGVLEDMMKKAVVYKQVVLYPKPCAPSGPRSATLRQCCPPPCRRAAPHALACALARHQSQQLRTGRRACRARIDRRAVPLGDRIASRATGRAVLIHAGTLRRLRGSHSASAGGNRAPALRTFIRCACRLGNRTFVPRRNLWRRRQRLKHSHRRRFACAG